MPVPQAWRNTAENASKNGVSGQAARRADAAVSLAPPISQRAVESRRSEADYSGLIISSDTEEAFAEAFANTPVALGDDNSISPQQWLDNITALLESGDLARAISQFKLFRELNPDFPIATGLQQKMVKAEAILPSE